MLTAGAQTASDIGPSLSAICLRRFVQPRDSSRRKMLWTARLNDAGLLHQSLISLELRGQSRATSSRNVEIVDGFVPSRTPGFETGSNHRRTAAAPYVSTSARIDG